MMRIHNTFLRRVIFLSFAYTQALSVGEARAPYAKDEDGLWVAGNDGIEIGISKKTGIVERLLDLVSQEDYCNQVVPGVVPAREFVVGHRIAGITLFDELTGREFSDLAQNATIARSRAAASGTSVSFSFEKTFPGAEFIVSETFLVMADHVRWEVKVKKTAGADRTLRVVQFVPLPVGHYRGWAPISDPIPSKPYTPFAIEYGQSVSGSVGEQRWRTNIPMMVYYSPQNKRALSVTSAFEVPTVRIRFLNNSGVGADFHWNSRRYPLRERPYLQVSNEYLGLRDSKNVETSLLIATHAADWRPALGWVYSKYRKYFDPDPNFDQWDGGFVGGGPPDDGFLN